MDSARLPADLLHDAAARIRWQQNCFAACVTTTIWMLTAGTPWACT